MLLLIVAVTLVFPMPLVGESASQFPPEMKVMAADQFSGVAPVVSTSNG
jgi:hypothetical protein